MRRPEICACVTSATDMSAAIAVSGSVSLYEVRIDLIGDDWPEVAAALPGPWIACDRLAAQGGACRDPEHVRLDTLKRAVDLGAMIIDVELDTPNVELFVASVKGRASVLISHHDLVKTDDAEVLAAIVKRQANAGADICKLVTTASVVADNVTVLRLARRFASAPIVTFAMGSLGITSRVLAPLAGSRFTYASLAEGHEAAPGQLTVDQLQAMYDVMGVT